MLTANVRAICPMCGPIDVPGGDIIVFACVSTCNNRYRIFCPTCARWIVRNATPGVLESLLRVGAHVKASEAPRAAHSGPISETDIDTFMAALARLPTASSDAR